MRILIMKRGTLFKIIAFSALFLCCLLIGRYMTENSVSALSLAVGVHSPICEVDTLEKKTALTIDTSFGGDRTQEILEVLSEKGVKATFCVCGKWAEENAGLMQCIYEGGHEVINHSMNHEQYTDLNERDIIADVNAAHDVLKKYMTEENRYIRLPYGAYNDNVLRILEQGGFISVGASVDAEDWATDDKDKIKENLTRDMCGGDILMIQNNTEAVSVLGEVLDIFSEKGFYVCTLGELIPDGEYFVSQDGLLSIKEEVM